MERKHVSFEAQNPLYTKTGAVLHILFHIACVTFTRPNNCESGSIEANVYIPLKYFVDCTRIAPKRRKILLVYKRMLLNRALYVHSCIPVPFDQKVSKLSVHEHKFDISINFMWRCAIKLNQNDTCNWIDGNLNTLLVLSLHKVFEFMGYILLWTQLR